MTRNDVLSGIAKIVVLFLAASVATFTTSCSRKITLSINNKNPPQFLFRRSFLSDVDAFPFFEVLEVGSENINANYSERKVDRDKVIWKIEIKPAQTHRGIDEIGAITFGVVPSGFVQTVPTGGPPPSLEEGKVYEATGAPSLMPFAQVRFRIKNGVVLQEDIP